jgi:FkbM family methyltransferase
MKKKLPVFNAQQGEDVYILNNYINVFDREGVFVELGAMDGIVFSNTKYFEDYLGFSGVLIEPTKQFDSLVLNRPNCACYHAAVDYVNGQAKFLGDGAVGGLVSTMSAPFRRNQHGDKRESDEYFVQVTPMKEILARSGISYIDLAFIDVEGAELVVLETMDFDIPVYIIVIELDGSNVVKDTACRDLLLLNNFSFDRRLGLNEIWINHNYFRKDNLYDREVPKFDFRNIFELGYFPFLEKHLVAEVESALNGKGRKRFSIRNIRANMRRWLYNRTIFGIRLPFNI